MVIIIPTLLNFFKRKLKTHTPHNVLKKTHHSFSLQMALQIHCLSDGVFKPPNPGYFVFLAFQIFIP